MSKVRCKVCGHEFEYAGPNALDATVQVLSGIGQFASAFTGNIFTMAAADNIAKNSEHKAKCPHCHSTNLEAVLDSTARITAAPAITINTNASIDSLLKRAALFLEDEEWDTANVYYNQILDADPENSLAYIGKMMATLHCRYQEDLQNCKEPFDNNANYKKALRFGDETQRATLLRYNEEIKARIENDQFNTIYLSAAKKMKDAATEEDFLQAISEFKKISGWKDVSEQITSCQKSIEALKIQNEQKTKRNSRFAMITIPILCVLIIVAVCLGRANKYNNAVALLDAEQYTEAAEILSKLHGYKDSTELLNMIETEQRYQAVLESLADNPTEKQNEAYQMLQELGDYKDAKKMLADFQLLESSWEWNYNGGEVSSQKTFEYSSSAYQMTVTSNGEPTSYTYKFNEQGQLLTCWGRNGYLLEYRYHPNGEIAYSSYPYSIDSETNQYVGFFETEYDTQGMPVTRNYKHHNSYEAQWNWDYHYAEDGSILSVDIRYLSGKNEGFLTVDLDGQGLEMVVDATGMEYPRYRAVSEDGKKETLYNVAWKDNMLVFSELTVSEYDDHHNPLVQVKYSSNLGESTYTYQYTYDEKKQILSSINVSAGATTEYTYDDYGNCIKEVTKNKDGKITNTTYRCYDYFYTPKA